MESFTSQTAQIVLAVIPIVGIVTGGVVVFFYLLWRHRQIINLIRSNLYVKTVFNMHVFSLLCGFLLTGIGSVLTILFIIIDGISYSLLGGLIPLALGIGFLLFCKAYFYDSKIKSDSDQIHD